jgi:hypothetical protein
MDLREFSVVVLSLTLPCTLPCFPVVANSYESFIQYSQYQHGACDDLNTKPQKLVPQFNENVSPDSLREAP